ncbi:MAG: hypothetical protein QHH04_01050 [Methanolinea sp.]|jgi:hypothetical protein|nr:hypothetical protein [Methanolinea sp.]
MKSLFLIAGFLVFMIALLTVSAAEVPSLPAETGISQPLIPHSFYGTITAAGSPVPAGVPVEVDAPGIRKGVPGNPVYSNEGGYGSPDPFKPRLAAQGTVEPGTELAFFVGGVRAEVRPAGTESEWQSVFAYSPGGVTNLDLRVSVPVTPDPNYRMTTEETSSSQPVANTPHGQAAPSQEVMLGLVAILVILAVIAFFLGRRVEKREKETGGEEGSTQKSESPSKDEKQE